MAKGALCFNIRFGPGLVGGAPFRINTEVRYGVPASRGIERERPKRRQRYTDKFEAININLELFDKPRLELHHLLPFNIKSETLEGKITVYIHVAVKKGAHDQETMNRIIAEFPTTSSLCRTPLDI